MNSMQNPLLFRQRNHSAVSAPNPKEKDVLGIPLRYQNDSKGHSGLDPEADGFNDFLDAGTGPA